MTAVSSPTSPLEPFFTARSIVFVGASPRSGSVRGMTARLRQEGYDGAVWMVNPKYPEVFGFPCFPSLEKLPGRPDLVVIAVRAADVPAMIFAAAAAGAKAALVISTGFADAGAEGAAHVETLRRAVQETGLLLCGPGSFGYASPHRKVSPFWDGPQMPIPSGNVGVVAQSGGFANVLSFAAVERGFGFSYLIATGSEVRLSAADFLRHVVEDEQTNVGVAVLEDIRDVPGLEAALVRAAELNKSTIVLVLGRSEAGQRATSAHSGALASRSDVQEAYLRRAGAIVVNTLDDLIETIVLLSAWQGKVPRSLQPLAATVSGGDCSMFLDLASDLGIHAPELAAATQQRLHELLPESTMLFNPIDLGTRPLSEEALGAELIGTAARDPAISVVMTRLFGRPDDFRRVAEACNQIGKPAVMFTRNAANIDSAFIAASRETGTPILKGVDRALAAVQRAVDRAAMASPRHGKSSVPTLPVPIPRGKLTEAEALDFLRSCGLAAVTYRRASTAEDAAKAAAEIGFPVAIKIDSPDIEHKSDIGGVRLSIFSAEQAYEAAQSVLDSATRAAPHAHLRGVIIQPMVVPQLELIVGVIPDPRFGVAVLVGFGGLLAEVLGRAQVRLAPVSRTEAEDMIERLLSPRRGHRPNLRGLNIGDAAAFIARFSEIAAAAGADLEAMEVNPLGVFAGAKGALALDCLILPAKGQQL
jgi:acyl-CoA synthetase (NDP forming)